MVLNFVGIHILICKPMCGRERERKIWELTWDELHTLLRVTCNVPASVLWDSRTVTVISQLQITSWLHRCQTFLPRAGSSCSLAFSSMSYYSYTSSPEQPLCEKLFSVQWNILRFFCCSGSWFRAVWCRLFILYLAYFFCQIFPLYYAI